MHCGTPAPAAPAKPATCATPTVQERERTAAKVAELHAAGFSQRQIAAKLRIGLATVNKMVGWAREASPTG